MLWIGRQNLNEFPVQTSIRGATLLIQPSIFFTSSWQTRDFSFCSSTFTSTSTVSTSSSRLFSIFNYLTLIKIAYRSALLNHIYTNLMDSKSGKPLEETADQQCIIGETFVLHQAICELELHSSHLRLITRNKTIDIPIQHTLKFQLIYVKDRPEGIRLFVEGRTIELRRDFWPRASEWEDALLSCITHKGFHANFKPLRKLGQGSFATVYLAEDVRKGEKTAVKVFSKENAFKGDGRRAIEYEISIMRAVKSQRVARLRGVYETENSLYLAMDYIEGVSLETFMKKNRMITTQQRRKILTSLLCGLRDLEKLGIVHRDIKPDNIMIGEDMQVKIVDFGLATKIDEEQYIFVRCGTPGYVAPEILQIKDLAKARLGIQSDTFSLGAIYYQLLYGRPLFSGKDHTEVLQSNRCGRVNFYDKIDAGFGEIELLSGMLEKDPEVRITPQQALESAFISQSAYFYCQRTVQTFDDLDMPISWSTEIMSD